jgi:hypothetical protein
MVGGAAAGRAGNHNDFRLRVGRISHADPPTELKPPMARAIHQGTIGSVEADDHLVTRRSALTGLLDTAEIRLV